MEFKQCLMSAQKYLNILWCKILDLVYIVYASVSYCEFQWAVCVCVSIKKNLENTIQNVMVTLLLLVAS